MSWVENFTSKMSRPSSYSCWTDRDTASSLATPACSKAMVVASSWEMLLEHPASTAVSARAPASFQRLFFFMVVTSCHAISQGPVSLSVPSV